MNTETTCVEKQPLTDAYLEKMNAYWRAGKLFYSSPAVSAG